MKYTTKISAVDVDTGVRRMYFHRGASIEEIERVYRISKNQIKKIIKHAEDMNIRNVDESRARQERDEKIRNLKDKGVTHRAIAKAVGCSPATVDRAINGRKRTKVKSQTGVVSKPTPSPTPKPVPQEPKQVQVPKSTEDFTFTFTIGNETYTFSRNSKQ